MSTSTPTVAPAAATPAGDSKMMVATKIGVIVGCGALSAGIAYAITNQIELNPDAQLVLSPDKTSIQAGETAKISISSKETVRQAWVALKVDDGDWTHDWLNGSVSVPGSFEIGPPMGSNPHVVSLFAYTPKAFSQTTPTPGPYWMSDILKIYEGPKARLPATGWVLRTTMPNPAKRSDTTKMSFGVDYDADKKVNEAFGLVCPDVNHDEPLFSVGSSDNKTVEIKQLSANTNKPKNIAVSDFVQSLPGGASKIRGVVYSAQANQSAITNTIDVNTDNDFMYTLALSWTIIQGGNSVKGVPGTITVTALSPTAPKGVQWTLYGSDGPIIDVNGNKLTGTEGAAASYLDSQIGYRYLTGKKYLFVVCSDVKGNIIGANARILMSNVVAVQFK